MTIYPYLLENIWVFDDERTGLKEEAFVLGMTEMISKLVEARQIPRAEHGFALTFGARPFEHDVELQWMAPAEAAAVQGRSSNEIPDSGNWYQGQIGDEMMVGWLCPALYCYFDEAPQTIFVKAEPLPAGFDPIWHVRSDDPRARRFMSTDDA